LGIVLIIVVTAVFWIYLIRRLYFWRQGKMPPTGDVLGIPDRPIDWLWVGVALMPPIFVWFLLQKKYGWRARAIGFTWLIIAIVLAPIVP
jgi:hypothetical protein